MSTKPNFHIAMPPRRLSDYPGPRGPRFHEDFDAPFSEAIMNASLSTVASFSSSSSSSGSFSQSSQQRSSLDDSIRRISPRSSMRTPSFPEQSSSSSSSSSPTEQWREFPWSQQRTQRKSSVNDRVKGWARRSLIFKSRPTSPDEPTERSFQKVDYSAGASTTDTPR